MTPDKLAAFRKHYEDCYWPGTLPALSSCDSADAIASAVKEGVIALDDVPAAFEEVLTQYAADLKANVAALLPDCPLIAR